MAARSGARILVAAALLAVPGCDGQGRGVAVLACSELAAHAPPATRLAARTVGDGPSRAGHCLVEGEIGEGIGFALALPERWNGRFAMTGSRGFGGRIEPGVLARAADGFASAGTDTGHRGGTFEAGWAQGEPERLRNFGHRAVHRTAVASKALIESYYGAAPTHSYFTGCSRGGGEALMEAQRYPEDFDGIVARAPSLDWTGLAARMLHNGQAAFPDPGDFSHAAITTENLELLGQAVLAACDERDGIADGVLDDPRECDFRVDSLPACANDLAAAGCLTTQQRRAIARVYAPLLDGDTMLYPGQPFGGEHEPQGWAPWIAPGDPSLLASSQGRFPSRQLALATEFFRHLLGYGPGFRYDQHRLGGFRDEVREVSEIVDASDTDLSGFRARGGRLLHFHGWSDPGLSALRSIAYYEAAERRDPSLRDFYRMFLMPGVLHCAGGAGPDRVDYLGEIIAWVEEGRTPARIVATKRDAGGAALRTRPLCPYPQRAVYDGAGSTDADASFRCRPPEGQEGDPR